MCIHYPIPISSLICSNLAEILIHKVPVLVDAHIEYVNMLKFLRETDEYKNECIIN